MKRILEENLAVVRIPTGACGVRPGPITTCQIAGQNALPGITLARDEEVVPGRVQRRIVYLEAAAELKSAAHFLLFLFGF